jgi:flagellar export protein FliJ
MTRFVFPLEQLLRLRRAEQRQAENALRAALNDLAEAEQAVRTAEHTLAIEYDELETIGANGTQAYKLAEQNRRIDADKQSLTTAKLILKSCEEEAEVARAKYISVRQAVQVLERLREERLREFKAESERQAQVEADELAVQSGGDEVG